MTDSERSALSPLLCPNSPTNGDIISNYGSDGSEHTRILPSRRTTDLQDERQIGWPSAFILVISRVIGSGIFAMPGVILREIPNPGISLLLWIAGALIAWCGLAVDVEFGCMFPKSGGMKVYLERSFPRPKFLASTMVAIQAVLLGFTATNCIIFAKYMLFAGRIEVNDANTKWLAIGLLTLVTVIHGCFYKAGLALQNALGWFKMGLVLFMLCAALFVVIFQGHSTPAEEDSPLMLLEVGSENNWTIGTLATATLKIYYSYAGLGNLNNVLSEVKNPTRTVKQIGPAALFTACTFYVLVNLAYLAVVPLSLIRNSQELIAALFFQRVFGHGFASRALPIAVALSAAGNVMVVTFSLARLNQEIAREGFLPYGKILGSSKPFGTPLGGLIVHYLPSFLVIILPPSNSVYGFIANVEGYAGQFFGIACAVGLILLRYREPDVARPFRAWLLAVTFRILLALCLIAAPWYMAVITQREVLNQVAYALVGIVVLLFGIGYWYVWTRLLPHLGDYILVHVITTYEETIPVKRLIKHPVGKDRDSQR